MIPIMIASLLALVPPQAPPVRPDWGQSPVWDDGMAEVAVYDATRTIYGRERRFETVILTMKEDMDLGTGVKADPPYEGRDLAGALKMNMISRIPTENYPYDYMTSVFVRRSDPRSLLKIAQSSQEWCGITYKQILNLGGAATSTHHSYFDGQADGSGPVSLDGSTFPEEQLILIMRAADLAPGRDHPFRVYETFVTNAAGPLVPRDVVARAAGEETVTTPAGRFRALRVDVHAAGERRGEGARPRLSFWIEKADRRAVLRLQTDDGRSLLLKEIGRSAYWKR